jgi:hypothetical protein
MCACIYLRLDMYIYVCIILSSKYVKNSVKNSVLTYLTFLPSRCLPGFKLYTQSKTFSTKERTGIHGQNLSRFSKQGGQLKL